MKLGNLLFIAVGILLSGCQSSSNTSGKPVQNGSLQAQIDANPNNFILQNQLFFEQVQHSEQTMRLSDIQQALFTGQKLLASQPTQDEVVVMVYRLMITSYFFNISELGWQQINNFYLKHRALQYIDIAPPHYLKFLIASEYSEGDNNEHLISLLKLSLKEGPNFTQTLVDLAKLEYAQDRLELAGYLFGVLAKAPNSDAEITAKLAEIYTYRAVDGMCSSVSDKLTSRALKQNRAYQQLKPDDELMLFNNAMLFQIAGQFRLQEFTTKALAERSPKYTSYHVESLLWRGKLQQTEELLNSDKVDKNESDWFTPLLYLHMMREDWTQVANIASYIDQAEEVSIYPIVYVAKAIEHEYSSEEAKAFLRRSKHKYEAEDWSNKLFEFTLGNIDEQELLQNTKNKCEKTEALFMQAYQYALANETEKQILLIKQVFRFTGVWFS